MWELVNTLANNKTKERSAPSKLLVDSREITDPHEICQIFNVYFSSIGSQLANEIPEEFHNNFIHSLPLPMTSNPQMRCFQPCNEKEILNIINSLDSNCSKGLDGISTKVIKCLKGLIANILSICINKLMIAGIFPDSLKIAKVTPIYKCGPKNRSRELSSHICIACSIKNPRKSITLAII